MMTCLPSPLKRGAGDIYLPSPFGRGGGGEGAMAALRVLALSQSLSIRFLKHQP